MKLLLVDNAHIYRTPDGRLFTTGIGDGTFFRRYMAVFDEVRFLAKTQHIDAPDEAAMTPIDAPGLVLVELPWYRGMREMAAVLPQLVRAYRSAAQGCDGTIFRVCQIESFMCYLLRRDRTPFYLEVVNDPATFVSLPRPLRGLISGLLRLMLRRADGAAFVTERTLQDKYLPRSRARHPGYLRSHYSTLELREEHFGSARRFDAPLQELHIVHVANYIADDVKGHHCVIDAAAQIAAGGRRVKVSFIGDGPYVAELQRRAAAAPGLADRIDFVGRVRDRPALFARLRQADVFLLPTRFEGLPRSLIEAMASGLPALSTPTAGVPELLEADCLFDPDDAAGFAARLLALMDDPAQLTAMSQRNLEVARRYQNIHLDARRHTFYAGIRAALSGRGAVR